MPTSTSATLTGTNATMTALARLWRTALAAAVLAALAACGMSEPRPHPEQTSISQQLLVLVNQARASGRHCGDSYMPPVGALEIEPRLVLAAAAHSEDMLAMGKLTHTGSDGSNPGQRIARTGYEHSAWGENAAWGYPTVESVMSGWLGSPAHCRNLMNARFTEFGGGKAGTYWTQVFARPRAS